MRRISTTFQLIYRTSRRGGRRELADLEIQHRSGVRGIKRGCPYFWGSFLRQQGRLNKIALSGFLDLNLSLMIRASSSMERNGETPG